MTLPPGIELPTFWWHGVRAGNPAKIAIKMFGFKLPHHHASDPGDLGLGIYLTNDKEFAAHYDFEGKPLKVLARFSRPLVLDFRRDHPMAKERSWRWLKKMEQKYGSPVRAGDPLPGGHGDWFALREKERQGEPLTKEQRRVLKMSGAEIRQWAAAAWRHAIMAAGHDSVLAINYDSPITLVIFQADRLKVI